MTSSQSSFIDARESNFNNIARDQNVFVTVINLLPPYVQCITKRRLSDRDEILEIQHKRPKILPNNTPRGTDNIFQRPMESTGNIADSFIVTIVQLLTDRRKSGEHHRIELELDRLRQTLTLTHLVIQTYEHTLHRNLTHSVVPMVNHVCDLLQELLWRINGYRLGLAPTSIHDLWRSVWHRGCARGGGLTSDGEVGCLSTIA